MLKIKDNIDLKELEKYDFKLDKFLCNNYTCKNGKVIYICEIYENKFMELYLLTSTDYGSVNGKDLNLLYDLIKADLVEKVDD